MFRYLAVGIIAFLMLPTNSLAQTAPDPHLWLEDIHGPNALAWVRATNQKTYRSLASQSLYQEIHDDALMALDSKDKLPEITLRGDYVYSLYKDNEHPRGVYRRAPLTGFNAGKPVWESVIDIDALSKKDDVKWVFQGMDCYEPKNERCLVSLSPGGGDAHELKEFNLVTRSFVEGGFTLPKSKMTVTWMGENHLFVATDFGRGTMTESGYPRIVKVWKRGTPLDEAPTLKQTDRKSVSIYANRYKDENSQLDLIIERVSYWSYRYYQRVANKIVRLNIPASVVLEDVINGQLVLSLQRDWNLNGQQYKHGTILLIDPMSVSMDPEAKEGETQPSTPPTVLIESSPSAIVESVTVNKENILVVVLEDVKSKVYRFSKGQQGWMKEAVKLPSSGQIVIETSNDDSDEFYARYEDFLTPPTLYAVDKTLKVSVALQQSPTFDSSKMKVEQYFTKSSDGTRVPYFAIMQNDTVYDGSNPTHMFAYGGFRASLTPSYSGSYEKHNGAYGKAWLERGGVYVVANIRGGGEYGPAWHAAALLENRYKAFEDFEAVAEDLITRKITSPQHLGIEGRSNGGLLVGASMIRRPDLYGAIVCGVPLLDMQRYDRLLAGSSWMAEYGDPRTDDWNFISKYSPYQLLDKNKSYPPVFFFTSTGDDRVHPGHARKMAAKMMAQGHKIEYFENTEGGHKGSVTNEQLARRIALSFTHLWTHLK